METHIADFLNSIITTNEGKKFGLRNGKFRYRKLCELYVKDIAENKRLGK